MAEGKSSIMPSDDYPGYKFMGWYEDKLLSKNPVENVQQDEIKNIYYGKWQKQAM